MALLAVHIFQCSSKVFIAIYFLQIAIRWALAVQLVIAKIHKYSVLHCCSSHFYYQSYECGYSVTIKSE